MFRGFDQFLRARPSTCGLPDEDTAVTSTQRRSAWYGRGTKS